MDTNMAPCLHGCMHQVKCLHISRVCMYSLKLRMFELLEPN